MKFTFVLALLNLASCFSIQPRKTSHPKNIFIRADSIEDLKKLIQAYQQQSSQIYVRRSNNKIHWNPLF